MLHVFTDMTDTKLNWLLRGRLQGGYVMYVCPEKKTQISICSSFVKLEFEYFLEKNETPVICYLISWITWKAKIKLPNPICLQL